jgi:hypothetical protein
MDNLMMVTSRKKTTRVAKTETKSRTSKSSNPEDLAKQILTIVERKYKVRLATRQSRIATKIGHAVREKLGKDIQAQLAKKSGSNHFDWNEWNNKIFPKILGKPDELKYSVELIANAISLLYDTISEETEAAINDLIEFNAASLKRRNELAKAQEEEDEEDLDDLDDDEDTDLDDLLDEDDEDDDDEDDFELDEDDEDFDDEDDED